MLVWDHMPVVESKRIYSLGGPLGEIEEDCYLDVQLIFN